jgi:hypothetical protein
MRALLGLLCVCVISAMIIFGVKPGISVFADTTEQTTEPGTDPGAESDNSTQGIVDTIANFDKIYTDALTEPFIKAESKIYDADIAEYYHGLMEKTGLTNRGK